MCPASVGLPLSSVVHVSSAPFPRASPALCLQFDHQEKFYNSSISLRPGSSKYLFQGFLKHLVGDFLKLCRACACVDPASSEAIILFLEPSDPSGVLSAVRYHLPPVPQGDPWRSSWLMDPKHASCSPFLFPLHPPFWYGILLAFSAAHSWRQPWNSPCRSWLCSASVLLDSFICYSLCFWFVASWLVAMYWTT